MTTVADNCQIQAGGESHDSGRPLSDDTVNRMNDILDSILDLIKVKDPDGYKKAMDIYDNRYNGNGGNCDNNGGRESESKQRKGACAEGN